MGINESLNTFIVVPVMILRKKKCRVGKMTCKDKVKDCIWRALEIAHPSI